MYCRERVRFLCLVKFRLLALSTIAESHSKHNRDITPAGSHIREERGAFLLLCIYSHGVTALATAAKLPDEHIIIFDFETIRLAIRTRDDRLVLSRTKIALSVLHRFTPYPFPLLRSSFCHTCNAPDLLISLEKIFLYVFFVEWSPTRIVGRYVFEDITEDGPAILGLSDSRDIRPV